MEGTQAGAPHVHARPRGPEQGSPQSFAPRGIPTAQAFRVPQRALGGANISRGRSVFEEAVRGPGAQVREVRLRAGPFWPRMGQEAPPPSPEVERVVEREAAPEGLTPEEARAMAADLGTAIEATANAVREGVACGGVDSFVVEEARAIREILERFAASAPAGSRSEPLPPEDLETIRAVRECRKVYEQLSTVVQQRTALIVAGGIVAAVAAIALLT